MTEFATFCTFEIDGSLFGIEISAVQEILRPQTITRVPRSGDAIAGLINLRGQVIPAVDLRRCLELPPRATEAQTANVVVRTERGLVSLLSDSIGEVLLGASAPIEPPPETASPRTRELIVGALQLPGRLLLVLDCDQIARCAIRTDVNRRRSSSRSGSCTTRS